MHVIRNNFERLTTLCIDFLPFLRFIWEKNHFFQNIHPIDKLFIYRYFELFVQPFLYTHIHISLPTTIDLQFVFYISQGIERLFILLLCSLIEVLNIYIKSISVKFSIWLNISFSIHFREHMFLCHKMYLMCNIYFHYLESVEHQ
jgi:hypothetical protein